LGIIKNAPEVSVLAASVPDADGVLFVPAFTGLFAPYWREDARGIIIGMTQSTTKEHIARALLEGVCFQAQEVLLAMSSDSKSHLALVKVDGGMSASDITLQILADFTGTRVERPDFYSDITALGAAFAAGIGIGMYKSEEDIINLPVKFKEFIPKTDQSTRDKYFKKWKKAVEHSLNWT